MTIKLNKKIDFKFTNYYFSCDNINKYNLKSILKQPKLKKIIVELPLDTLITASIIKSQYSNENIKIKSILFLYLLHEYIPFINFNKNTSIKDINKSKFSVKFILNKTQDIYSFIHTISEKVNLFEKLKNNVNTNTLFVLQEKYTADCILSLAGILNKYIKNINAKELSLNFYYYFYNPLKKNKSFLSTFNFNG